MTAELAGAVYGLSTLLGSLHAVVLAYECGLLSRKATPAVYGHALGVMPHLPPHLARPLPVLEAAGPAWVLVEQPEFLHPLDQLQLLGFTHPAVLDADAVAGHRARA